MVEDEGQAQLELVGGLARARAAAARATAATLDREHGDEAGTGPDLPVAQVLVDVPLAHLDRPFDYRVPAGMDTQVRRGSRVKVRFAGQDVDGYVVDRVAASDHPGRLSPLRRAVSAEPVLTPEVARLSAAVAEHYAGTRADVLRLAVPPRHAATERQPSPPAPPRRADAPDPAAAGAYWARYRGGPDLVRGLAAGGSPRAVWTALPGEDWATGLAHAVAATEASGRGALVCVPDRRDLDRIDTSLTQVLGPGRHVLLTADLGAAARYRSFLAVARGAVRVVAGTRAAAFAPVHDLGLVAVWDDGDDLFAEPRAPYPHTREVLLIRAHDTGCAALLGATARSVEAAALVDRGWAREVVAPREAVRAQAPMVSIAGATERELERDPLARVTRLPHEAHAAVRDALTRGPVLVQTPRSGYAVSLVCERCRAPGRCDRCAGPLQQQSPRTPPTCGWCGAAEPEHRCPACGGRRLRAPVLGERRTAEELGRAFPRIPVRRSAGDRVLDSVPGTPAIVVATPGAEPVAEGGYAAVLLLDTWLVLARPDLRTAEEAGRRWFNAATLARPASAGGRVVAVGDPQEPTLQALVRWDPAGLAERDAEDRASAHLPPASRLAVLTGEAGAVEGAVSALALPPGAEVLGPVPDRDPDQVRVVVRVPRRHGPALARSLREVQGVRAARKLPHVRIQIDPYALG